ncbi:MAG: hypothetical protein GXY77_15010 [Fibrobacter sp.]|nr:hypothetical protein [Fibrobacter sp.]
MYIIKLLLFTFLPFSLFSEPDSITEILFSENESIETLMGQIKRIQVFKGHTRVSSGEFFFTKEKGFVYSYKSPSEFIMLLKGNIQYSVDPVKSLGVRKVIDKPDPLAFLLQSGLCRKDNLRFRGSVDNRLIFSCGDLNLYAAFERQNGRALVLEYFDSIGILKEQIVYNYGSRKGVGHIPVSVVGRTVMGDQILVDSIILSKVKINSKISSELFKKPKSVNWIDTGSFYDLDRISQ